MVVTDSLLGEFVSFFSGGCKAPAGFKTGFELEHFIVDGERRNVNYSQNGGAANAVRDNIPNQALGNFLAGMMDKITGLAEPEHVGYMR